MQGMHSTPELLPWSHRFLVFIMSITVLYHWLYSYRISWNHKLLLKIITQRRNSQVFPDYQRICGTEGEKKRLENSSRILMYAIGNYDSKGPAYCQHWQRQIMSYKELFMTRKSTGIEYKLITVIWKIQCIHIRKYFQYLLTC